MKVPKVIKRLCPYCRKHADHKVSQSKRRTPGSAHPLSAGSKKRAKDRGLYGMGNNGRRSRKAISAFKMTGKKATKKSDFRYQCTTCKKSHCQKKGIRAKKFELK